MNPATPNASPISAGVAWQALAAHLQTLQPRHLRDLFAADPARGERMALDAAGVYLDYSKNRITDETLRLLLALAAEAGLRARIDAMFGGEKINVSERRAVLHVALRAPRGASIVVDGENVVPGVHEVLDRMAAFAERVRSGAWKGHTGKRIRNVVNIGIGGSDLGPVMAYEALRHYSARDMVFRFVSNVDGTDKREAHAVDGHRAFARHLGDLGRFDAEPHRAPLGVVLTRVHFGNGIDVTGDEVPAEFVAHLHRRFEVHSRAGAEFAEIRARQRFFAGLKAHRVAVDADDGEAAAVDRDAVAHLGVGGELGIADYKPHTGWLGNQIGNFS